MRLYLYRKNAILATKLNQDKVIWLASRGNIFSRLAQRRSTGTVPCVNRNHCAMHSPGDEAPVPKPLQPWFVKEFPVVVLDGRRHDTVGAVDSALAVPTTDNARPAPGYLAPGGVPLLYEVRLDGELVFAMPCQRAA